MAGQDFGGPGLSGEDFAEAGDAADQVGVLALGLVEVGLTDRLGKGSPSGDGVGVELLRPRLTSPPLFALLVTFSPLTFGLGLQGERHKPGQLLVGEAVGLALHPARGFSGVGLGDSPEPEGPNPPLVDLAEPRPLVFGPETVRVERLVVAEPQFNQAFGVTSVVAGSLMVGSLGPGFGGVGLPREVGPEDHDLLLVFQRKNPFSLSLRGGVSRLSRVFN
jgi:hypothetical protein